jgi:hypothetical protein
MLLLIKKSPTENVLILHIYYYILNIIVDERKEEKELEDYYNVKNYKILPVNK